MLNQEIQLYIRQLSHVHNTILKAQKKRENQLGRNVQEERRPVQPGDYVYLRVFKKSCLNPRAEGPYRVTQATPWTVRITGSNLWYHLNSYFRAWRLEGEQEDDKRYQHLLTPQQAPAEGDDGYRPPRGTDTNRSAVGNREVQTRPGADMPRVHRFFSPKSLSASVNAKLTSWWRLHGMSTGHKEGKSSQIAV